MKKVIVSMVLALMMVLAVCTASAELVYGNITGYYSDSAFTPEGYMIWGSELSQDDPYKLILAIVVYENGDHSYYYVSTQKDKVLDAFIDAGLIEIKEVGSSYTITTVDTIKNADSAWRCYQYNGNKKTYVPVTAILKVQDVVEGDIYVFQSY